jgi:signal peptidase I
MVGGATSFLLLVAVGLLATIVIRAFVAQVSVIISSSMEPTLRVSDRVLVLKGLCQRRALRPDDIIVFRSSARAAPSLEKQLAAPMISRWARSVPPRSVSRELIKRVTACEGDSTTLENGLRGVVPSNAVFVIGDNHEQSRDSRDFGMISESQVVGRAVAVVWPLQRARILK